MNIQGTEISDSLIVDAFGRWDRDEFARIVVLLKNGQYLFFESHESEEVNAMLKSLNEAVAIGLKNTGRLR